jgi:DNA polymerase-3 subunit epsilon
MVGQYFNLLDRVLEDRRLDPEEAEALHSFASELCFSRDRVTTLHASYMATLCAVARGDGVVSDSEHSDLQTVATLLSVADWESLLGTEDPVSVQPQLLSGLNSGMTVCFTGDSEVSRANLVSLAESIGLVVKPGVSKKLDLLVVADPDSASGKAKKAREYGIRIMTVGVFLSMLPEPELGQDRFSRP